VRSIVLTYETSMDTACWSSIPYKTQIYCSWKQKLRSEHCDTGNESVFDCH